MIGLKKINFTHLLLTRFNLDFSPHTGTPYICDDDWHQDRFRLFNTFCLPSVAGQTCKDFEWIIFFNVDVKELYQSFINETEQALENVRFLFVKPEEDHRVNLVEYIKRNSSSDYLITTRIDNDDCISSNFIESIQTNFMEKYDTFDDEYIVNAGTGYQFETIFPFRRALVRNYEFSPFLSLFSKMDPPNEVGIVLKHNHDQWEGYTDFEELSDTPLWTQIIHKNNVSNQIRSMKLTAWIPDEKFPVLKNVSYNNFWFGFLMLPIQFVFTAVKRLTAKLENSEK